MKNIAITILVVLVVSILGLRFMSLMVRETEAALVTTFGEATDQITKPGWHFVWPPPIQKVYKYDTRMRVLEAEMGETTTKGAIPIIVNTYIVWKVQDPLKFANSVGTIDEAEDKLLSQIANSQNNVVGQHAFSEFVNSDPGKIRFKEIEQEMLAQLQDSVRDQYGIEVKTLGIKQLKISEDASAKVFDRMRAHRNRITENIISQGVAEATRIRSDANAKKSELIYAVEARAKAIRGTGDAEAAKYYKMLKDDPELAMFLRNMDSLKRSLKDRTTIVISGDTAPFEYLKEKPELKVKK